MSPFGDYKIGHEKEAGAFGYAPGLLNDILPLELTFVLFPLLLTIPLLPPVSMPFTPIGIISWLLISLSLSIPFLLAYQLFLRHRFRKPYTNTELYNIFTRACRRMGITEDFEFWSLEKDKPVVIPVVGLMYKSFIISQEAEEALLAYPEEAEVILADTLVHVQRQLMIRLWIPIIFVVVFSTWFIHWEGLTIDVAVIFAWALYGLLVLASLMIVIFGRGSSQSLAFDEYSLYPDVARCRVFRGAEPTYAEMREISKKKKDPLARGSNRMRGCIAFFVALVISLWFGVLATNTLSNLGLSNMPSLERGFFSLVPMILSTFLFGVLFFSLVRRTYEYEEISSTS